MIKFTVLYSGSSGNCSLVQSKDATVLIDAGFTAAILADNLKSVGVLPEEVDAIVVTHEHSDHTGALAAWTELYHTPVFAHEKLAPTLLQRCLCGNAEPFSAQFTVKDLAIDFCECSHDSAFCCGYRFTDGHDCVASITDTGMAPIGVVEFLSPARTVLLESNHDVDMLMKGPYPYPLKQRILSPKGHLSNKQSAAILSKILEGNVQNVVLGHISEHNNTPELAFFEAMKVLSEKKIVEGKDVNLYVAKQRRRLDTI